MYESNNESFDIAYEQFCQLRYIESGARQWRSHWCVFDLQYYQAMDDPRYNGCSLLWCALPDSWWWWFHYIDCISPDIELRWYHCRWFACWCICEAGCYLFFCR